MKSFQVTGAFAEFERSMIRQRINAGLKRAVEAGKTRISEKVETRIQEQLRAGKGMNKVAREVGVGTGTVQRIAREMPSHCNISSQCNISLCLVSHVEQH